MRIRTWILAVLCLFAMPAATALADTMLFYDFDPDTGTMHYSVQNDFELIFETITDPNDPESTIDVVRFRKVIAFVVGLEDEFVSVAPGRFRWKAEKLTATTWEDFSFENDTLTPTGVFGGDFDSVVNPPGGGISLSQAGMYFDNDGPELNNHIEAGEFASGFTASVGDSSFFGDFSSAPFTPGSTPGATVIKTTTITGDDGDGVQQDDEVWTPVGTPTFTFEKQDTSLIPLPTSALTGLSLLGILALRRRARRRRL